MKVDLGTMKASDRRKHDRLVAFLATKANPRKDVEEAMKAIRREAIAAGISEEVISGYADLLIRAAERKQDGL